MTEALKKKLEIAKKAGKLEAEIVGLERMKESIHDQAYPNDLKGNTYPPEGIVVKISFYGSNTFHEIDSQKWFGDTATLHDALIAIIQPQIDKRKAEIDELIKFMV